MRPGRAHVLVIGHQSALSEARFAGCCTSCRPRRCGAANYESNSSLSPLMVAVQADTVHVVTIALSYGAPGNSLCMESC